KPQPPALPVINVVAEHKGWLFEHWKQALAATPLPGYRVAASERPLAQADAWIFLRASEAGRAPDPMRSLVQLHDLGDAELYRSGGVRADVARCGGLMLAHADQLHVLEQAGIDLSRRRWLMQPVGWSDGAQLSIGRDGPAQIGWVGRPGKRSLDAAPDSDPSGLSEFIAAVKLARQPLRVVLAGERLDAAVRELKRAGIDCMLWPMSRYPLARCAQWIARLDAVVVNGRTDCSPWPLFDALHAGVPVIAPHVGWAPQLLADGERGRLVDDVAAMARAIDDLLVQRETWQQRRRQLPPQCPQFGMRAWLDANLCLAAELAQGQAGDRRRAVA
ncbi:MAG: glycosyltransferase, partial [Lysobacter sp.]|nr:glycosyltransferase [Lysobacter sp.]